jgi:hypothetical protein
VKTTPTDAHLARIFYSVLIEQARSHPGQSVRYKELLNRAKRAHPNDEVVQSAIPIGIGRRLEVIVQFVRDHHLPPLTCLAVNESGHPGASYRPVNGSWQTDMDSVARYDWSEWQDRWDTHIDAVFQSKIQPVSSTWAPVEPVKDASRHAHPSRWRSRCRHSQGARW